MISHFSHRILTQGWTTPAGSSNADLYAAQSAQKNAPANSAAAMATNVSAAAGLGASASPFAAAMEEASAGGGTMADDGGSDSADGADGAASPQQLALAGPLLGHHHGSILSGTRTETDPKATPGQGSALTAPSSVKSALQTYQTIARGLH